MSEINLAPAMLALSQGNLHARAQEAGSARASAHPVNHDKDPALWEVSLKFEAMLLQQMMSAMRKTVPETGMITSGFAGDMYSSMFDQAIAETGSQSGSLGIAENVYRQMSAAAGDGSHNMKQDSTAEDSGVKANPISADIGMGSHIVRPKE